MVEHRSVAARAAGSIPVIHPIMVCFCIKISGFVQGVFFRYSAKVEAEKLALVGYVKNLDDGLVESVVCGKAEKIDEFVKWCHKGPVLAQVEKVEIKEIPFRKFENFNIV
ncbi:MAG: Acylphosphatase [Candidatus Wolfebacteria bacterium GW2011_GWC1_37_10]|uniref:Acylphosphatase n=1 Tax=Candidatus Wolfebacteria bacterium GW2011_GWC1_37_10 TaxID=1619010 RepID=A0A0G0J027_9BACT|nr:MAG: Acylphosphatase [Candidatus Wolfebacteria bacterium GW2011_GWC1_37_10]